MTLFNDLAIAAGLLLVGFLWLWATYNSFVKQQNQVKTDFSDIDIQVKRRSSLIQNLADMVKGYAKHEKETFSDVAKARSAVDNSQGAKDSAVAENMLSTTLRSLFAVVEAYPELQASKNFQGLQDELKETENLIATYREQYNLSVQKYNTMIQTFPNLFASSLFRFSPAELFQASSTPDNKIAL